MRFIDEKNSTTALEAAFLPLAETQACCRHALQHHRKQIYPVLIVGFSGLLRTWIWRHSGLALLKLRIRLRATPALE